MEIFQKLKAKDVLQSAKKETNVEEAVLRECGKISSRLAPALLLRAGSSSRNNGKFGGWEVVVS